MLRLGMKCEPLMEQRSCCRVPISLDKKTSLREKKHVDSTKDRCRLVRKTFKMILPETSSKFASSTGDNEDR